MNTIAKLIPGIVVTILLAMVATFISGFVPYHLISGSVFALLIGMLLNPIVSKYSLVTKGIGFTSKQILRLAIILMGLTLSFTQVLLVGRYSLIVMVFTLFVAFGGGYLFGRLFKLDWRLSSLISAGTGICGGSAIAALAPTIDAEDKDIAYAISATFLFDILMVILFPLAGRYLGMSDIGFGLWAGTAINDTSSVVAAGYAFSDAAGSFSVIVKLTRTLSIIPVVLIFSMINARIKEKSAYVQSTVTRNKVTIKSIFPYFILLFLLMVAIKSIGVLPVVVSDGAATLSKFLMVMALGAIGLKTNFKQVAKAGFKPLLHGFIISSLVVVVAFLVQLMLGQL